MNRAPMESGRKPLGIICYNFTLRVICIAQSYDFSLRQTGTNIGGAP
jgi:hypothetical protein